MKTVTGLLAVSLFTAWAGCAQAAKFNLVYDSMDDGVIDPGTIVGTGTFVYDGPIVAGSFLLSELTGVSYSSTFVGNVGLVNYVGPPFDPADLSLIGIEVADTGGGIFQLVFSGESAVTSGSLDILNPSGELSHQPGAIGGGVSGPQLYFAGDTEGLNTFGDYVGTSAVPLPAAAWLFGSALLGLAGLARRAKG